MSRDPTQLEPPRPEQRDIKPVNTDETSQKRPPVPSDDLAFFRWIASALATRQLDPEIAASLVKAHYHASIVGGLGALALVEPDVAREVLEKLKGQVETIERSLATAVPSKSAEDVSRASPEALILKRRGDVLEREMAIIGFVAKSDALFTTAQIQDHVAQHHSVSETNLINQLQTLVRKGLLAKAGKGFYRRTPETADYLQALKSDRAERRSE